MNEWLLENSNAFNSGVGVARLAEQRRESDLDRDVRIQELKSQDALRRLTESHLAQQMSLELQKHNEEIQMKADAAKANAQFQVLNSPVIPIPIGTNGQTVLAPNPLKAPSSGHAFLQAYAPLARNPAEAEHIASTATMMTMQEAHARQYDRQAIQNQEVGKFRQVTDPQGRVRTVFQSSANSAQLADPAEIQNLTNPDTGESTSVLTGGKGQPKVIQPNIENRQINADIRKQQDRMVAWVEKERSDLIPQLHTDARGFKTVPPELVPQVSKMAGIPISERTKLIQEQLGAEDAFRIGRQLAELLPENSGIKGWWKKALVATSMDKKLGVENATDAFAADTLATFLQASVVKSIKSDSNIAEPERNLLASKVPSATALQIDPRGELRKLETVINLVAQKSRAGSQLMGTPINPVFLTPEEIRARRDNGQITSEQAAQMLENSAAAMLTSLRRMR